MSAAIPFVVVLSLGALTGYLVSSALVALRGYARLRRQLAECNDPGTIHVTFRDPPRERSAVVATTRPHRPRHRAADSKIAIHRLHKFAVEARRA